MFASTPSQEQEINGLVRYIYSNIFPVYFNDEDICEFEQLKVLRSSEDYSTLKDAFQVMTCMQTLISILESAQLDDQYEAVFNKNAATLKEFGVFFPFQFEQFAEAKRLKNTILSVYTKADNELII